MSKDRFVSTGSRIKGKTRGMKDSGVEWIGEIPEDWEVKKLGNISSLYIGNSIRDTDKDNYMHPEDAIPYIATKDVSLNNKINYKNGMYIKNNDRDFRRAYKGSSLICIEGGSAGKKIAQVMTECCFGNKLCCVDSQVILNNFLYYYLLSPSFNNSFNARITGLIPGVTLSELGEIEVVVPTKDNQRKIANFLDGKVSLIDDTIEKTKQSIEDYKKYKQALITETVTKGLNPDVEMKQSGIEWVGEVPKHWRIIRIKHLATVNPNKSEIKHLSLDSEVTFIPMEKIIGPGQVDYSLSNTIENLINGYTYFKDGDIIMAKVTPCFENSNIAIVNGMKNGIGFGTTELHVLRCNDKCYNKYLFYYLQSSVFVLKGISKMYGVGGLKRVSEDFVSNHKLAVPSYEEQKQIADYLDKKCSEIGKIISQKEQLIKELEDYKKSLIYEYVTGKKRVV